MSAPGAGGYAPEQLRAALWTQSQARVHAVLDGQVLPGLPQRLQEADCAGWDCLQRGALGPQAAAEAAYIVELREQAPFTHWLLHEAATDFADWGLLSVSHQPLLALREWARDLQDVRTPDGRRRPWRWWDPGLLQTLLPGFSAEQRDLCFAVPQQLVLVGAQRWVWWWQEQGQLRHEVRPVLAQVN